jgi:hypothetical protein
VVGDADSDADSVAELSRCFFIRSFDSPTEYVTERTT